MKITIDDGAGSGSRTSGVLTVNNVAPTVLTPVLSAATVYEGDSISANADFTDPGDDSVGSAAAGIVIFDGASAAGDALDKLDDLVAALVKIYKTIIHLEKSEMAGAGDLSDLKLRLSLAAQSVAQTTYTDVVAALGPAPSAEDAKSLSAIDMLINSGMTKLSLPDYPGAVLEFRKALQRALELIS